VRAVVHESPDKVALKDVPDARIEEPTDLLVTITATNMCGSDLYMYEGRTSFETGRVFGHENLGEAMEVENMGAIGTNPAQQDPAEVIKETTRGPGADNGSECVGHQAHDPPGKEDASLTLNGLEAQRRIPLDHGLPWFERQATGTGQAPVNKHNRALQEDVAGGKAETSFVVSHEVSLEGAPDAYTNVDKRTDGQPKVVMHP
jgi:glutathione-independent formaldehyde dehydrogenase